MFRTNCPICGTNGKEWHKNPDVFMCPNCLSLFSTFGLVLESRNEYVNTWS